jgi:DNA-binding NarL/FixJ family response regulator
VHRRAAVAGQVRLLIVEDHAMVADGLEAVFDLADDIDLVGIARTAADAMRLAEARQPHVICMDQVLPDGRGTEVTAAIRLRWPHIQVVMLTASDDDRVLGDAIEAGCVGFLTKGACRGPVLVDAVRRAALGEVVLPASLVARLLPRLRSVPYRMGADLTARERDVLGLLVTGMATRDVATHLGISFATTRNHIQGVLSKLGAHSKLEAVAVALREGIVTPPTGTADRS